MDFAAAAVVATLAVEAVALGQKDGVVLEEDLAKAMVVENMVDWVVSEKNRDQGYGAIAEGLTMGLVVVQEVQVVVKVTLVVELEGQDQEDVVVVDPVAVVVLVVATTLDLLLQVPCPKIMY